MFGFAMEIWKWIITLLTLVYPRVVYTWGVVLWVVVQDKPIVYEQKDVTDVIAMRHKMQKTLISLNPLIETDKPQI